MTAPLYRLPPMDALRGFVAVARRMSITVAAEDLHLTQSAVSRQIQTLEARLGCKLLVREYRGVRLTEEGRRLFQSVDPMMRELQELVETLGGGEQRKPVTITASMGVVGLWLLPRLGNFITRHPEVDVRVAANNRVVDLDTEGVDLAIRYCARSAAPEGAIKLFGDEIIVVGHPDWRNDALNQPEVFARQVLLEFDDPDHPWLQWSSYLGSTGLNHLRPARLVRFNQYDQLIQAAVNGQGLALGRRALVADLIREGRLQVFDFGVGTWSGPPAQKYAHWLIQASASPSASVRALAEWLVSQAALSHE